LVSFFVATFLCNTSYSDLIDLAIGGIFFSSGFVTLLPRAEANIGAPYPFASLLALIVFIGLSFLQFIRDSLALMDESLVQVCDVESFSRTDGAASAESTAPVNDEPFVPSEQFPVALLYGSVLLASFGTSIWLVAGGEEQLNNIGPMIIAMQFVEFMAVGKMVCSMPIRRALYWVLAVVAAVVPSVLIAIPTEGDPAWIHYFSGFSSAVVLGVFLFLGSISIHEALDSGTRPLIVSAVVLVLAFAIPAAIRASAS
jgi:hypothetical protein